MARDALTMSLERSIIEGSDSTFSQFTYVSLAILETIVGSPYQALQYGLQARKFFASTHTVGDEPTESDYQIDSVEISHSTVPSNEE